MSVYGSLVAEHGLAESHRLILSAVPPDARVLDVGCSDGYLGALLESRDCTVTGVEADEESAARAGLVLTSVVNGDIENSTVRASITGTFDRVLFGDVLEHLRDPEAVLAWARERLTEGGRIVVSLPNIAHWTGRRTLLRGAWPQADFGLFDRTHLHFYTRGTARDLVERAGLSVVGESFAGAPLPLESRLPALGRFRDRAVAGRPELFALQVVLTCAPG